MVFRGAVLETTDHVITRDIERKLPWWLAPGRPAAAAFTAWKKDVNEGPAIEPETLFVRK
jgi:hypothetical protein